MIRLFIAIDLPERIKDDLIETYQAIPGVDWIDSKRMHCTLRFIGNESPSIIDVLAHALKSIKIDPFSITLKTMGFFPLRKEPRILWAGIAHSLPLIKLHHKIEKVCTSVGLPSENRRFHPHVTIARLKSAPIKKVAQFIVTNSLFTSEIFEISQFHLFQSILGKQKAHYERLVSFSLAE